MRDTNLGPRRTNAEQHSRVFAEWHTCDITCHVCGTNSSSPVRCEGECRHTPHQCPSTMSRAGDVEGARRIAELF